MVGPRGPTAGDAVERVRNVEVLRWKNRFFAVCSSWLC